MNVQDLVRSTLGRGFVPNPYMWAQMLRDSGIRQFQPTPGIQGPGVPQDLEIPPQFTGKLQNLAMPHAQRFARAVEPNINDAVKSAKLWYDENFGTPPAYDAGATEWMTSASPSQTASPSTGGSGGYGMTDVANTGLSLLNLGRAASAGNYLGMAGPGINLAGQAAKFAGYPIASGALGTVGSAFGLGQGIASGNPEQVVGSLPGLGMGLYNLGTATGTIAPIGGGAAATGLASMGPMLAAAPFMMMLQGGLHAAFNDGEDMFSSWFGSSDTNAMRKANETKNIISNFQRDWPTFSQVPDYNTDLAQQIKSGEPDWNKVVSDIEGNRAAYDAFPGVSHFLSTGGGRQQNPYYRYPGSDVSEFAQYADPYMAGSFMGQMKGLDFLANSGRGDMYTGERPGFQDMAERLRGYGEFDPNFFAYGTPSKNRDDYNPGISMDGENWGPDYNAIKYSESQDWWQRHPGGYDLESLYPGREYNGGKPLLSAQTMPNAPWRGDYTLPEFDTPDWEPGKYDTTAKDFYEKVNPNWKNTGLGRDYAQFESGTNYTLDSSKPTSSSSPMGEGAPAMTGGGGSGMDATGRVARGNVPGAPSATASPIGSTSQPEEMDSLSQLLASSKAFLGEA